MIAFLTIMAWQILEVASLRRRAIGVERHAWTACQLGLVVFLLVAVGLNLIWLTAPLVLVRLAGKTLGGLLFARMANLPAGLLSTVLLPPGVLGIALAWLKLRKDVADALKR